MSEQKESESLETFVSEFNDFNSSITYLFETIMAISNKFKSREKKFWMECTEKYIGGYTKAQKPSLFYYSFLKFYSQNQSFFTEEIFQKNSEGQRKVNDSCLKCEEYLDGPGFTAEFCKKQFSNKDVTIKNRYCKGHVLYFSDDNEQLYTFSIPISEIYLEAVSLWRTDDPENKLFVLKLLKGLFYTTYNCLPAADSCKKEVLSNIKSIDSHLSTVAPKKTSTANVGAGFGGFTSGLSTVLKSAGLEGKLNESDIGKMIGNSLNEENLKKIGGIIGSVFKTVETGASGKDANIGDVVKNLGKTLQSDSMTEIIGGFLPNNGNLSANTSSSASSSSAPKNSEPPSSSPVDYISNPEDQS